MNLYLWRETVIEGKRVIAISTGDTVDEARGRVAEIMGFDSEAFDEAPIKFEGGAALISRKEEET